MTNQETANVSSLPSTRIQEVVASARWLLNMRWIAGVGVLAATWFARVVLKLAVPTMPLNVVGLTILTYNALLCYMLVRIQAGPGKVAFSYSQLAHLQVVLDWLAMTGLIHFSGGVESPIIFFFIFHIIIVSLLFNQRTAGIYAFTALLLVGATVWLEFTGVLPHIHVGGFLQGDSFRSISFVIGIYGAFAGTSLVSVYLSSSIAERLRHREDQLGTLYLAAQTINSTLDLPEVLNRLVKATAEAMNVSGASIGLLDPTGSRIETAAAYGLSDAYLNKGPILLEEGYVHTRVISSGAPIIIQEPQDHSMLQYPNEMETEGIRSSLYVRLQARHRTLGVVRVYGHRPNLFTADDARFLSAIAAQGAVAIENALAYQTLKKLDLDKSQFVRSVTHELRSPVTGAQS
ncbi:MAG: GAF domain-containing protein, partial [Anaerolineales bacterium]|nr:GAF domain-containing protein [Anaerolineales bacterium]